VCSAVVVGPNPPSFLSCGFSRVSSAVMAGVFWSGFPRLLYLFDHVFLGLLCVAGLFQFGHVRVESRFVVLIRLQCGFPCFVVCFFEFLRGSFFPSDFFSGVSGTCCCEFFHVFAFLRGWLSRSFLSLLQYFLPGSHPPWVRNTDNSHTGDVGPSPPNVEPPH